MKKIKTRHQAERAGYIVDTHCYPWFAYKGPRFAPTDRIFGIATDKETELRRALYIALTTLVLGTFAIALPVLFGEPDRRPLPQPSPTPTPVFQEQATILFRLSA
jgi:hypothetical protein